MGHATPVFSSVVIPPALHLETTERGKAEGYDDVLTLETLESDGWFRTLELSPKSRKLATELSDVLGTGEAEAIALTLERKERLLVDDLKGRRTAEVYRLETTTTMGLLLELLAKRAISALDYQRNVKVYGSQGWISADVMQEFIKAGNKFE